MSIDLDYHNLVVIRHIYNNTDQQTIKCNIKRLMRRNKVNHAKIAELLNISIHTARSYTNKANSNKPELYNLLILASFFDVEILDMFKL